MDPPNNQDWEGHNGPYNKPRKQKKHKKRPEPPIDPTRVADPGIILHPPLGSPFAPPVLFGAASDRVDTVPSDLQEDDVSTTESQNETTQSDLIFSTVFTGESFSDDQTSITATSEDEIKHNGEEPWTEEVIKEKLLEALQMPLSDNEN